MGLKRWVVSPMSNSLQVRELLGIDFLREPNYNYNAMRLLVWSVAEALEGKWGSRRTIDLIRDTLHGVGETCGE
jgi:hypothetical protein